MVSITECVSVLLVLVFILLFKPAVSWNTTHGICVKYTLSIDVLVFILLLIMVHHEQQTTLQQLQATPAD